MVIVDKDDLSKYKQFLNFILSEKCYHCVWGPRLLAVINGIMSSALYYKILKENV